MEDTIKPCRYFREMLDAGKDVHTVQLNTKMRETERKPI
jgi:hypothetical protein